MNDSRQVSFPGQQPQHHPNAGFAPQQMTPQGGYMQGNENNPLLTAATPLVTLITQIRHTAQHNNVEKLRAQSIEEVKSFERRLQKAEYPEQVIVAARYCICTAIDEAVTSQPWGIQSVWPQQSLLTYFHRESWGGKRFFIILGEMMKEIRVHIDFVELIHVLLCLGYEGELHGSETKINEIRSKLSYHIRTTRRKPNRTLSSYWKDNASSNKKQSDKKSLKRFLLVTAVLLLGIGIYFNAKTYSHASDVTKKLNSLSGVSPITIFSDVISRPIVNRGFSN